MTDKKQIRLAFVLQGAGRNWGDWRHPKWRSDASVSLDHYKQQAAQVEAAKFDLVFVTDSVNVDEGSGPHNLNRFEPLTVLSALAAVTSHIGLVGTASTSYSAPYTLARQFASLDMLSGGRAGWNIVTTMAAAAAANYGLDAHPEPVTRYRMAAEHVDVVQGLWHSWEDDAFPRDKQSGVFFKPEKLHRLDHEGEYFKVAGPLSIARSPQGQPVLFQAGASGPGRAFAARYADAIFIAPGTVDEARVFYRSMKAAIADAGRDPDSVLILPSALPVLGRTDEEAAAYYEEAVSMVRLEDAMAAIQWRFDGVDLSKADPDAPFPDIPEDIIRNKPSFVLDAIREAHDEGLTLRQAAYRLTAPNRHFCGRFDKVAEAMIEWVDTGAADGFMMYEVLPGQLDIITEHLVPCLQRHGRFRRDYAGRTLRDHLGLDTIPNRHAAATTGEVR
jgi:FMN-dependent oxidoreductase (nitrilotriacetate monooxygenase family)